MKMNEKFPYDEVKLEVIHFDSNDVIATSGETENTGSIGGDGWEITGWT